MDFGLLFRNRKFSVLSELEQVECRIFSPGILPKKVPKVMLSYDYFNYCIRKIVIDKYHFICLYKFKSKIVV